MKVFFDKGMFEGTQQCRHNQNTYFFYFQDENENFKRKILCEKKKLRDMIVIFINYFFNTYSIKRKVVFFNLEIPGILILQLGNNTNTFEQIIVPKLKHFQLQEKSTLRASRLLLLDAVRAGTRFKKSWWRPETQLLFFTK